GWLELGLVLAQRSLDPRISMASLRTNRHFAWMIPVSDVCLFGVIGLVIALLGRCCPRQTRIFTWRFLIGLGALVLLLDVEGMYSIARLALACGFGIRFGPTAE